MNCEEVQSRLSEFLDRSLDPAQTNSIESHLSSCSACGAEAEVLAACIRQVAELPLMDPPPGFTRRVMAHVREAGHRPGLWERVFLSLRSQVPLQATAVVLVGILAVYLLENKNTRENLPSTPGAVLSQAGNSAGSPDNDPSESSVPAGPETSAARLPSGAESRLSTPARERRPAQSAPSALSTASQAKPAGDAEPLPRQNFAIEPKIRVGGLIAGTPVSNPAMGRRRIGSAPFSLSSELDFDRFRAPATVLGPLADYELIVRRHPGQLQSTPGDNLGSPANQSEAAASESANRVARLMATIPDATKPQVVWVTLAQSQLDEFKKDLISMATVESESATSFRDPDFGLHTDHEILVKLTVLPAAGAARGNPVAKKP